MSDVPITGERMDALGFLNAMFSEAVTAERRISIWTLPDKASRFCSAIAPAAEYVEQRARSDDVYVGVGLRRAGLGPRQRGGIEDVTTLTCMWADVDVLSEVHPNPELPKNKAVAEALLEQVGLPPSIVLDSGYGLQAFWLFTEPWQLDTPEERQRAIEFSRRWALTLVEVARLQGVTYDPSTCDITRVLRIPGTWNRKRSPAVQVVATGGKGVRYDVGDLEDRMVAENSATTPAASRRGVQTTGPEAETAFHVRAEPPVALTTRAAVMAESDAEFARVWNMNRADFHGDCSSYLLSVANYGVLINWADQDIVDLMVLFQQRWAVDYPARPWNKHPHSWYVRTLKVARDGQATPAETADRTAEEAAKGPSTPRITGQILADGAHFAQNASGVLFTQLEGVYRPEGEEFVRRAVKAIHQRLGCPSKWTRRRAAEVVEYIRVDARRLWMCPPLDVVNVRNGLLNVETRALGPHDHDHLSPVQLPITYDPDARCPAIEQFVAETFPPDAHSVAWALAADLMTPDRSEQFAVMLLGVGANGKSVWLTLLSMFLGRENVANVSLQQLERDRFASATLEGRLANICADLPSAQLAGTSTFKTLTGGDDIAGERKFRDGFSFRPFARLFFSANHPPHSKDASPAFFRRWRVIEFTRIFEGDDATPRRVLDARLTAPQELSGLLNKALNALPALRAYGLPQPTSMAHAAQTFREMTDPVAGWLEQETFETSQGYVAKRALLDAYNRTARANDCPPMSAKAFGLTIRQLRPQATTVQRTIGGAPRVKCWAGIGLRADETGLPTEAIGLRTDEGVGGLGGLIPES